MKSIHKIFAVVIATIATASIPLFCSAVEEGIYMNEQIGVSWTGTEWDGSTDGTYPNRNCDIVQIGREYARTDSIPYSTLSDAIDGAREYNKELSPYVSYISRTEWKFNIVNSPSDFDESGYTEFYKPEFDVSAWDELYVPSSWQSHGYDKPVYNARGGGFFGNFGNPAKTLYGEGGLPMPEAPTIYNPIGLYRHTFNVPADWNGSKIFINFEGVKSAYYFWINGIQVGYAEDSFTSDEFDITNYVKPGQENVIAVKVYRWADSSWLEQQDMIDLSGIFRDVYLYSTPNVRVRDFEITTDFDKSFTDSTILIDVDFVNYTTFSTDATVKFRLFDADGNEQLLSGNIVSKTLSAGEKFTGKLSIKYASPKKWSAETPYLYTAVLEETMDCKTVYESYLVGFRKITYKTNESGWWEGSTDDGDLIRINGKPIMFRGVNRHDTHPTLGNAVPRETYLDDVKLMKENNINAVRTSHYPNDPYFLYLCDVYGIYVLSEANQEAHQWYEENNAGDESMTEYLTDAIVDREYNMIERDKNHSSIVMWSLGNESQSPTILKNILINEYTNQNGETHILREYTKSRPWHYEPLKEPYGVDVGSSMYGSPVELENVIKNRTRPFIKCEYAHAMQNSLGNFYKFWEIFEKYPMAQGGFVWDFVDQTVHIDVPRTISTALVPQNDASYTFDITNCEQTEFDGKKALKGYVVFPNSNLIDVTGKNITIDTMVKLNPVDSTGDTHWEFVTKGDYQFLLKARRLPNRKNIMFGLSFATLNASNQPVWTDLYYTPASDEENESYFTTWHRLTGTYDGQTMRMYIDGELKASKDVVLNITHFDYCFAINKNSTPSVSSRVTDAYVNYVKIFNTAKSIEEINSASYTDNDCILWMDMAEAFVTTEVGGYEFDSYGGDWGDSTNSGMFCANGIVYADRTPQPELFEVKHQHREIKFEAVDVEAGIFDVNNFFLFRNVSEDFVFTWNLLQNDEVVDTGTLDVSKLGNTSVTDGMPGKLRIKVPYSFEGVDIIPGSEYYIEFRVTFKNDEGLLKAGHEICREQYVLNYVVPGRPNANDVSTFSDMVVSENENVLTFTGVDFVISFDKSKGIISEFKSEDDKGVLRDLIVPENGPKGSFYRAPTSNDLSEPAVKPVEAAFKNHGDMVVSSVNVDDSNPKAVKITVEGSYKNINNLGITLKYTVYSNGQIKVDAQFRPNYNSTITFIPVVGMQTTIPEDFENIEYYGKGPFENYNDRSLGASLGKYFTTVDENFENYIVPEEMGNRTGVRYVTLTDENGFGLLVSANGSPFEMSALHYNPESLTGVRHIYQVEKLPETILRINATQLGVGGDTCAGGGYIPDTEFIPYAEVYDYSYILSVKRSDEDAMTKSMLKNEEAPDKSYLQKSVDMANELSENNYTKSSWEKLREAVKAAEAVLAIETPTYDILDPAKDVVDSAISALVSVVPINLVMEYEFQFDPNNYTYDSYKAFYNALQNAKNIKNKYVATSEEIESAAELVEIAVNNLDKGEHETPEGEINVYELNFVLKNNKKENGVVYTRLSEYLYNQKYKEIEKIIASPTSQEEVDATIKEAKTISEILEKATIEILGSKLDVSGSNFSKFDSGPAWNNGTSTGDKVFDGNTSTFYDYENDANGYTGVDLGEGNSNIISGVKIYARIGPSSSVHAYENRTKGAMIQVSDNMDTWVTLYTLVYPATIEGSLFEFNNDTSYRYIRYYAPSGNCNVAEVVLYENGFGTDKTLLEYAIEKATEMSYEGEELADAETVFITESSEQSVIDETSFALLNALYPQSSYKVYGTVELVREYENTSYETNEYDSSAIIVLQQNGNEIFRSSEKDLSKSHTEDGKTLLDFSIDTEKGEYLFTIEKNGYAKYTKKLTVTDNDICLEIDLIPGDIKESYEDRCGDGIIDIDDFIRVLRGFASTSDNILRSSVDINEDGVVNVADVAFVKANFGKTSSGY